MCSIGVAIGAMMLGGVAKGYYEKQAYKEQARQADVNAQVADDNARKLNDQADEQARNNAMNEENKRRKLLQIKGQNIANVGASGVTMSGSALQAMGDSAYNAEMELAIDRYNGRQKVDNIFQNSTDSSNQANIYRANAAGFRKAGKAAMMNNILQAGVSSVSMYYGGGYGKKKS